MRKWLEPSISKEEISKRLNTHYGKERERYCFRVKTYDDLPERIWEGSPTHWVTEYYVREFLLKKFTDESGRPVIIQRRKCISKPTPLPPEHKPIKPDVGETILLHGEWEDYGDIVRPSNKR